jgi:uncharacterized protein YkwD
VLQPYVVTPTAPGDPPAANPLVPGVPTVTVALPVGDPGPVVPPVEPPVLPPIVPLDPSLPAPPTTPSLPAAPTLPTLPTLPSLPTGGLTARAAAARCANVALQPTARNLAKVRTATLCLINAARSTQGLRPLRKNHRLSVAASRFSSEMVAKGFFAHVSPSGSTPITRVRAARYFRSGQRAGVGENVGFGESILATPLGLIQAWMASTTHRENIMDRGWKEVGLGIVPGIPGTPGSGATYTTDFGVVA